MDLFSGSAILYYMLDFLPCTVFLYCVYQKELQDD